MKDCPAAGLVDFMSAAKSGMKESVPCQDSAGRAGKARSATPVRSEATRPYVLIADDNKDIREFLAKLLEKQFSVTTAIDGRACLNKASAAPPDCILADINMPHLNGVDTIKLLRRDPRLGQIPIIAMTAYGNWAAAKALEAGATTVMLKPLDGDELLATVKNLVKDVTAK